MERKIENIEGGGVDEVRLKHIDRGRERKE